MSVKNISMLKKFLLQPDKNLYSFLNFFKVICVEETSKLAFEAKFQVGIDYSHVDWITIQ